MAETGSFEVVYALLAVALLAALVFTIVLLFRLSRLLGHHTAHISDTLEYKHRVMLTDLHGGLSQQSDRLNSRLSEELARTRETLHRLQLSLAGNLDDSTDRINAKIDARLEHIAGKVNERVEDGFRRTNETFANVMQRLATIDEAQKKIEMLTGTVVTLQELLGDRRTRGALGGVQLEALVRNVMPPAGFEMPCTLSNGARVDCALKLPAPTGLVCIDSGVPLEHYKAMLDPKAGEAERVAAQRLFRADVRKHIDAIAEKYIIENETSDGAVMFLPAEAVLAELHAYHPEVVDYAHSKRVWIVSPTTLMAVLNTARAVLKDVEARKQIQVMKEALVRLGQDFRRFEERMRKLADHIRLAHEDAEDVQVSSRKITQQFQKIESAALEPPEEPKLKVVERREDGRK